VDHRDNHAAIAAAGCARFGDRLGQFRDITKLQDLLQSGAATIAELTARPPRRRSRRGKRLTLAAALKQADKAGAKVSGAVLDPSGAIELRFGEPGQENSNSWDEVLNRAPN